MAETNDWITFDGQLQPEDQPVATASSRGLMYGEGVFETLRIYKNHTLLLNKHVERLKEGLNVLGISPSELPSLSELGKQLAKLLQKKSLTNTDGIARIQCWQEGGRGYHTTGEGSLHYMISASACPSEYGNPDLATVSRCRIPSQSLPSVGKFTNGINYILSAREAGSKGADDALMQTVEGWISETTIANLFWIEGNKLYTPSLECDLLPGITRHLIINIVEDHEKYELKQGKYELSTLGEAEAVIICNSVRELVAVQTVDGKHFEIDHPITKELQKLYSTFRDQNLKALPSVNPDYSRS